MGRSSNRYDWITTALLFCLGSFGLFILLTIQTGLFLQQLLLLGLGFFLLFIVSRIDAVVLWWSAPLGYIFANIFLLLSYFGPSIRGATRWIFVAGFQLQPSEIVKPILLVAFAHFISRYPPKNLRFLPFHVVLFLIPFLLVFRQPDLGSSIVYGAMWLSMMIAGGLPVGLVALISGITSLLYPLVWKLLAGYQKDRILTFLNPALDPKGAGYNAIQAMIAVGSGQLFGRGLGRGTQSHLRFLPEYHTDFIFATLIEELGFLGGLVLFTLYGLLLWRILSPLLRRVISERDSFVYSIGLFSMILVQITINTGMNMGIIPVTGITLPFVSYGGSSILSFCLSYGIFWAVTKAQTEEKSIAIH